MAIRVTYDGPVGAMLSAAREAGERSAQREERAFALRNRQVGQQDRALDLRERGMDFNDRRFDESVRQFNVREHRIADYQESQQDFAREQYQTRRRDAVEDRAAAMEMETTRLSQPLLVPEGVYMTEGNKRRLNDLNEQIATVAADQTLTPEQRVGTLQALSARRDRIYNTGVPDTRDTRPLSEQFADEVHERDGVLYSRDRNGAWREVGRDPSVESVPEPFSPDPRVMADIYTDVTQALTKQADDGPDIPPDPAAVRQEFFNRVRAMQEAHQLLLGTSGEAGPPAPAGPPSVPAPLVGPPPPAPIATLPGVRGIAEQEPELFQQWMEKSGSDSPDAYFADADRLMGLVLPDSAMSDNPRVWKMADALSGGGDPLVALERLVKSPSMTDEFRKVVERELRYHGEL